MMADDRDDVVAASGADDDLDGNMVGLVEVLDELPGVEVISCCGGHEPGDPGAEPEGLPSGEFYIDFRLDDDDTTSLSSLALITAVSQGLCDPDEEIRSLVTVWYDDEGLRFDLRAQGLDPRVLSDTIRSELAAINVGFVPSADLN